MTGRAPRPAPVVVRSRKTRAELAVGPGEVWITDERGRRAYPRRPVEGAAQVVALRVQYWTESGVEPKAVELVGDRGQPVDRADWQGKAAPLDELGVATGLPVEWVIAAPADNTYVAPPVPPRPEVVLRRAYSHDPRAHPGYDPSVTLVLRRADVTLAANGQRWGWPRVGYARSDVPAVARLKLYVEYDETLRSAFYVGDSVWQNVVSVALRGPAGEWLAMIGWAGGHRELLQQAAFAVALPVEMTGNKPNPDQWGVSKAGGPIIEPPRLPDGSS
jgi:hypothetical protein